MEGIGAGNLERLTNSAWDKQRLGHGQVYHQQMLYSRGKLASSQQREHCTGGDQMRSRAYNSFGFATLVSMMKVPLLGYFPLVWVKLIYYIFRTLRLNRDWLEDLTIKIG